MEDHHQVSVDVPSQAAPTEPVRSPKLSVSQLRQQASAATTRLSHWVRSVGQALITDWRTHKYVLFALLVLASTITVVVAYYLNHPQPQPTGDTLGYLRVAQQIQVRGQLVDAGRLPGYPLLIVLVYALIGQGNLFAVSVAQAILFVLATLELYVLAALVLRRAWLAFLIGLLVGTNLTLLFHVKLILSEALSLWLLVSLALAVAFFVYTPRARSLWLVAILTLALLLTRAEWIYLPVPLFGYLLLMAACQRVARRLLSHALLALALLYAILGNYIYINALLNHFSGVVVAQNINAFGKVLQYDMQDEAPPQYATVRKIVDTYLSHGIKDPYTILHEPSLSRNYWALAGEYARAIIARHPGEFFAKSVPLTLWSLTDLPSSFYYDLKVTPADPFGVAPTGPFGKPLLWLEAAFGYLYSLNTCFPLCAALWLLLLCRRRTRTLRSVQVMGAVVLLTLYGLIFTTLGGIDGYQRLHTPFNSLLILVVWGTLLTVVLLIFRLRSSVLTELATTIFVSGNRTKPPGTVGDVGT